MQFVFVDVNVLFQEVHLELALRRLLIAFCADISIEKLYGYGRIFFSRCKRLDLSLLLRNNTVLNDLH